MKSQLIKKSKAITTAAVSLVAGLVIGGAAMYQYNIKIDIPFHQKLAAKELDFIRSARAANEVVDGKRGDIDGLRFLARNGSSLAYIYLVSRERSAAFKDNEILSEKSTDEEISSTNTRDADKYLLEAMDNLDDYGLYVVLSASQEIFHQASRASIRQKIENGETSKFISYHLKKSMHSSLTDGEKAKLQSCYQRLESKILQRNNRPEFIDSHGLCSDKSNFIVFTPNTGHYGLFDRIQAKLGL